MDIAKASLLSGVNNEAFRALIRFQMARADEYYLRAQPGISLLSADCHMAVRLSATLYRSILDRIRLNNFNVFTKRASVPLKTKLKTASLYWFMDQFKLHANDCTGIIRWHQGLVGAASARRFSRRSRTANSRSSGNALQGR